MNQTPRTAKTPNAALDDFVGASVDDLDTPCLVLDKVKLEANLQRMAEFFAGRECQLRPHFKNHKCTSLARKQLATGSAIGITCAKLGEAEVLVDAGVHDVLIANQVVGRRKVQRLAELASRATIRAAIDSPRHVEMIAAAASERGSNVGLLIEVDIGMGRCGLREPDEILALARQVQDASNVSFDGFQAYEGHAVCIADREQRGQVARESIQYALDMADHLRNHNVAVDIVSGGSSSTYDVTGTMPGVKELQAGTYATMDWAYKQWVPEFEIALNILARVISRPRDGVAVLDFGVKGSGDEFGGPRIVDFPDAEVPMFLSEEHCTVKVETPWVVGQAIRAIPSHSCTTCNLYRQFFVVEDNVVVDVWPIEGAGRLA
jgi:D-serine deaminase-like pyridoxal phosphate-dependent protein